MADLSSEEEDDGFYKQEHDDKIVLTVQDTGVGIRREDKERLFKLFGCLNTTKARNTQGIGLGLVISKMIT